MPRYFFDIHADEVLADPEGIELANNREAMSRAYAEVRALAAADVREGSFTGAHSIVVVDSDRNPVGSVRFDDAVSIL